MYGDGINFVYPAYIKVSFDIIFMIIVSNNHDESIILVSTTCMHINFIIKIGDQLTLALLQMTGRSTIGGNSHQFIKSWV